MGVLRKYINPQIPSPPFHNSASVFAFLALSSTVKMQNSPTTLPSTSKLNSIRLEAQTEQLASQPASQLAQRYDN